MYCVMYYKSDRMTRLVYSEDHIGALLGLLYVDPVHHEVLIETCPIIILSATAMKDFRN